MSAPGNSLRRAPACIRGFTLIELLLVLAITALATAGVGFALREAGQSQLEREGLRLVAMLESARARSRASGVAVVWQAGATGFSFTGLPPSAQDAPPQPMGVGGTQFAPVLPWLADGVTVASGSAVTLGPEPIIAPQEIVLLRGEQRLHIATDGLHAFALRPPDAQQSP